MKKPWLLGIFLSLSLFLTGCAAGQPAAQPSPEASASAPVSMTEIGAPEVGAPEVIADEDDVIALTEEFGRRLKLVSLLAPADAVKAGIRENYGDLVSPELLSKWESDPESAPGRLVSSPWPDRIEVQSVEKTPDGKYKVQGVIVELTSEEEAHGGAAAKRNVTVWIELKDGCLRIYDVVLGEYIAENPVEAAYNAAINAYLDELPAVQPGTAASAAEQSALVEEMIALYNKNASSKELHELYLKGITKLSPAEADTFTAYAISGMRRNSFNDYAAIEKYSNDPKFLEKFLKEAESVDFKYVYFNLNTDAIKDPDIKALVENAKAQGYFVASAEGMLFPLVDFTVFAQYRRYNSEPMAELIETLAIDNLDPMVSDAAFIVDGSNLAARTWNIEKMLADYKGTRYERYLAVRLKDHMTMLFFGVNNTPTFSYETGELTAKARTLFNDVKTLDDTLMGQMVAAYLAVLDANGGRLDDAAREKANAILNTIDEKYGLADGALTEYGNWMSGTAVAVG